MSKSNITRGPGRPPEFVGTKAKAIVNTIKTMGLTGAREYLATVGVQVTPGQKREKVFISMPTLGKLAKAAKIKLKRGRPKLAA